MTHRNYVFTLNNPSQDDQLSIRSLSTDRNIRFLRAQREVGERRGIAHLQGYVEFRNPVRPTSVQRLLGGRSHIEPRRGSAFQAYQYVNKANTRDTDRPFECQFGTPSTEETRRRTLEIIARDAMVLSVRVFAEQNPGEYLRHHRGINALRAVLQHGRDGSVAPKVEVYYGEPGTGKSRKAWEENKDAFRLPLPNPQTWWDGYDCHDTVVVDDYYGWIKFSSLLNLLDRYPVTAPTKGGFAKITFKKIVFTSNVPWEEWYDWERYPQMKKEALGRRITKIIKFTSTELGLAQTIQKDV